MKTLSKTLRDVAVGYCKYIALRTRFRSVVLAQSVEARKSLNHFECQGGC